MLLDGHTINDNWLEAAFNEFELLSDLYGLERIEIVRGPASVLYGSGAFLGVLNLVSPDPTTLRRSRLGVTAVGDGVFRAYGHVRQPLGEDAGLLLSAGGVWGQGRDFFSPARQAAGLEALAQDVGRLEAYTARFKGGWRSLTLQGHYHSRDKGVPTGAFDTIFGDDRTRQFDERGFLELKAVDEVARGVTLSGRIYGDLYGFEGDYAYPPADGGRFVERFQGLWAGLEARALLRPFDGALWSVTATGERHFSTRLVQADEAGLALESDYPYGKTSVGALIRQELHPLLTISAGARLDAWIYDGLPEPQGTDLEPRTILNVNPRLVLLSRPFEERASIKLIGSRGFRAPSIYELTYSDGNLTQRPSPELEPETIYSGELELGWIFEKGLELVGAAYVNQIDNRIEFAGAGSPDSLFHFENQPNELWTAGLEAELRRAFFQGWMFSLQYAYQRGAVGPIADLLEGSGQVPNFPQHMASAKLVLPLLAPTFWLANRLVFESSRLDRLDRPLEPALIWDVTLSGQARRFDMRYAIGVRNVLDWSFAHPVGDDLFDTSLRQPGRQLVLDLGWQF